MKIFNMLTIIATIAVAGTVQAAIHYSTSKTKPIIGYPPYMASIGTILESENQTLFDQNNQPVTSVNSIIYIPSTYCQYSHSEIAAGAINQQSLPFYHFSDLDSDDCATDFSTTDTSSTDRGTNLQWYVLEMPEEKGWLDIKSWNDLQATEIASEQFIYSMPESLYRPALKIPEDATGKRIGFIYTPTAKTGNPATGSPIKVWDLDYFFGQDAYHQTGIATQPNDGKKLDKINQPSGGGVIVQALLPPAITDLHMKGIFALEQSLEAEFNFVPNTTETFADVSRLWWGKSGTTNALAHINNPDYQTERTSPKLTPEDIATIYEVSVLPIKQEAGYFAVGKPETIQSDDPRNEIEAQLKI